MADTAWKWEALRVKLSRRIESIERSVEAALIRGGEADYIARLELEAHGIARALREMDTLDRSEKAGAA